MRVSYEQRITTAARLKKIRKSMGMSQDRFAEYLDISLSAYKKIESGENSVSSYVLYKLVGVGISADYLLTGKRNNVDEILGLIDGLSYDEKVELITKIMLEKEN